MNLNRYKKASDFEVEKWLYDNIPDLTEYQKRKIREEEIVRFAPIEFFKYRESVTSLKYRLTAPFYIIVWLLIVISLPLFFMVSGKWGYNRKQLKWFSNWGNKIGILTI